MGKKHSEVGGGLFPTTHWSVINVLKDATPQDKEKLWGHFVEKYTPAFRIHLRHGRGCQHEDDLQDIVQGFLTDKFVVKNILTQVDEQRGRLRDYLRKSLDNYLFEQHRSKASAAWQKRMSLDGEAAFEVVDPESTSGVCAFDIGWALSVLTMTVERTKAQYLGTPRETIWHVFRRYTIDPLLTDAGEVSYEQLADEFGLSVKAVQNRRISALRAFGKHLTAVITEYASDKPELIAMEVADLDLIMCSPQFREAAKGVSY